MAEPKDPSVRHFYISLVKSFLRIVGSVWLLGFGLGSHNPGLIVFAGAFLMAEILGIAEEF